MRIVGIDYIIIIAYLLVIVASGILGSIRAGNQEDYLVAGRHLPLPIYVACITTVVIGGGATFGAATQAFNNGISAVWMVTMFGVGILSLGFLLSTKLSNLRILTISDMLTLRYKREAGMISAIISAFYTMMVAVTNAIALGVTFSAMMGWPLKLAIFIAAGIALAYTLLGGMTSIALTDTIQFTIMTIAIFFILLPQGFSKVGGIAGLKDTLPESYFDIGAVGVHKIFSWFILFALGLAIGQDIWQRVFSAKNSSVAKRGTVIGGIYTILWAIAMTLAGMFAFSLAPGIDPQNALSEAVLLIVPAGFRGLVFAGIMSAFLSTISGCMLASSTLILNDILRLDNGKIARTRVMVIAVGGTVIALSVAIQSVLTALDIAYAILSGCIFVPVIAGFFWKRANWKGACGSMVLSFFAVVCSMIKWGTSSTAPIMIGIVISVVSIIVISLITEPEDPEKLTEWENKLI